MAPTDFQTPRKPLRTEQQLSPPPTPSPPEILISPPSPVIEYSKNHFSQDYIPVSLLGAAYSALSKANADDFIKKHIAAEAPDLPYSKVVVVKFAKPDHDDALAQEIRFMTVVMKNMKHPYLNFALDAASSGPVQWLVTPLCTGGDLFYFTSAFPDVITAPFVFSVALKLLQALVYFHYGLTEHSWWDDPVETWKIVFHNDLYEANVLVRPNAKNPAEYPDIVLADFGQSRELIWYTEIKDKREKKQLADYHDAADVLTGLLLRGKGRATDIDLSQMIKMLGKMKTGAENILPVVRKFVRMAERVLKEKKEPMPEAAVMALQKLDEEGLKRALEAYYAQKKAKESEVQASDA
ncbi:hypothetical protein LTR97_006714 [Elasticomyces elasticus]|uniref:Protein kinase domain-containing protein n=1 Tax=Elasticomyces elasticus TaxID=574655 RepID=A0AAN7W6Y8_9PEZI|nr:hypothetical protein LTR97_006714 [Elasticomyces elasticus]